MSELSSAASSTSDKVTLANRTLEVSVNVRYSYKLFSSKLSVKELNLKQISEQN